MSNKVSNEPDTSKPMDILDDEEFDRVRGLIQRDSLVRDMGVADIVYKLLNISQTVSPPIANQNKSDKQLVILVRITCLLSFQIHRYINKSVLLGKYFSK